MFFTYDRNGLVILVLRASTPDPPQHQHQHHPNIKISLPFAQVISCRGTTADSEVYGQLTSHWWRRWVAPVCSGSCLVCLVVIQKEHRKLLKVQLGQLAANRSSLVYLGIERRGFWYLFISLDIVLQFSFSELCFAKMPQSVRLLLPSH